MTSPKKFAAALLTIALLATPALAEETKYVSDVLQITVRTGPSTENKIIGIVQTGQKVVVLQANDDGWYRVRMANGREGWTLGRYLMDEKPAMLRLAELGPKAADAAQRIEEISGENRDLKKELGLATSKLKKLEESYNELQKASKDVLQLQTDHKALSEQFEEQARHLKELTAENESLRFATNLKWFLAGAGVLLVGWIMGLALHRKKRRAGTYLQ